MITCCIDIGLRNLALCIMDTDKTILLWEVYNVLDSDDYKCDCKCKNGNTCGKKCNMKYTKDNNINYTCKTHFPKDIIRSKSNDYKKKNIDDYLLQDIAKSFLDKIYNIYNDNVVFKDINRIFIELQPMCNKKALFTSHILYGKLVELYRDTDVPIRFVRASQKLKAYTGPEIKCELKGKYAQRKYLGIQYCRWFLENHLSDEQREKWLPYFLSNSKKDDISDAFLMSINAITGIPKKQLTNKKGKCIK
jgi:hypothetical protein